MAPKRKKSKDELKLAKKLRDKLQYETIKMDPVKSIELKLKEEKKYKKRKEQGKVKSIKDMCERDKRAQRKQWRSNSLAYLKRKREDGEQENNPATSSTPNLVTPVNKCHVHVSQVSVGRKKVRRDRSKIMRKNLKLKAQNDYLTKRVDSLRKRIERLKKQHTDQISPRTKIENLMAKKDKKLIRRRLLFAEVLENNLKNGVQKLRSRKAKRNFANIVVGEGKWLKKYGLLKHCTFIPPWVLSSRCNIKYKYSNDPKSRLTRTISEGVQREVVRFFEEDDNSRCCPGKKDSVTRSGIKKQKRILLADMKVLHKTFNENSTFKISYPSFCRLRPFWVIQANVDKRDTCLCQLHENFNFLLRALFNARIIKTADAKTIKSELCCTPITVKCLQRLCGFCKNKTMPYETYDGRLNVSLQQWAITSVEYIDPKTKSMKSAKRLAKVTSKKSCSSLVQQFEQSVIKYLNHEGNIIHQHTAIKYLKATLNENEILIHSDFSENYATKYSSEVQGIHFGGNRQNISLHTVVVYLRKDSSSAVTATSFCTASENLDHGPPAIWAHLQPVFSYINYHVSEVKRVHFLSDGPSSQYRNKTMFYIFQRLLQLEFPHLQLATWNYHEAGHGKGAPDGVGGRVKSTADRAVSQGNDITDVNTLVDILSKYLRSIQLHVIDSSSIQQLNLSIPGDLKTFNGTMKVHQVVWEKGTDNLHMNKLSCFHCPCNCQQFKIGFYSPRKEENSADQVIVRVESFLEIDHLPSSPNLARKDLEANGSSDADGTCVEAVGSGARLSSFNCTSSVNEQPSLADVNNITTTSDTMMNSNCVVGLCYKCGGRVNSKRVGVRCEICEKVVYHKTCFFSPGKLNYEEPVIISCTSCDKLAETLHN